MNLFGFYNANSITYSILFSNSGPRIIHINESRCWVLEQAHILDIIYYLPTYKHIETNQVISEEKVSNKIWICIPSPLYIINYTTAQLIASSSCVALANCSWIISHEMHLWSIRIAKWQFRGRARKEAIRWPVFPKRRCLLVDNGDT